MRPIWPKGWNNATSRHDTVDNETRAVAEEDNIRVNCPAPGWIATDGPREYWESLTPVERAERGVPSKLLKIDQISEAVMRIVDDHSLAGGCSCGGQKTQRTSFSGVYRNVEEF